jgi:hypothetical protein
MLKCEKSFILIEKRVACKTVEPVKCSSIFQFLAKYPI